MQVEQALRQLGIPSFRGLQEQVVTSILSGRDTMVLMATSGGKSLCYMVPALCLEGYTIVISPLLALIADQKTQMESRGIRCVAMNGDMSFHERKEAIVKAWNNEVDVILMSPELLANPGIIAALSEMPPTFVAFDEAHCISTWGQDFRPEYSEVGEYLDSIEANSGQVIIRAALTATASELTVRDIIHFARLKDAEIIASPLVRHNLRIFVRHQESQEQTDLAILNDIAFFGPKSNGIIYCQRRKECERLGEIIKMAGYNCVVHHSGMPLNQRQDAAAAFMTGQCNIIIATIGFGMGINKSDVRYVIHNGISSTPEAWYQEVGRGGRDGLDACAITYVLPVSTPRIRFGSLRRGNAWESALLYVQALYGSDCRMKSVMRCFGEEVDDCGKCDVCHGMAKTYKTSYDTTLVELIKKLPGKKPEYYLPFVHGLGEGCIGAVGKTMDALFMAEYLDYDFLPLKDCPPLTYVELTAKSLRNSDFPALDVPLTYNGGSGRGLGSLDDILELLSTRAAYNDTVLPENVVGRIKMMRPTWQDIRDMPGVAIAEHILKKMGPDGEELSGVVPREVVRSRSRSAMNNFRL